ncbi:MAG: tyrosine--tRNA ligase [Deltaproteobacteria bacterium]|nr:tyrosine--tRNA ligase [Deltaproteobacteria bacterium]
MVNAFNVLNERGFVHQVTDEQAVRALFEPGKPPVVAYCGYDPTGDSLHVGHLFTLMALMHIERCGHRAIVVLGGGTAMVGDPSGKTEMRQMISAETIANNKVQIEQGISRLLNFKEGNSRCVNNAKWLAQLNYIDFLRDIGRHFSVNRMLAAEAYKLRLERGLSFLEFNYQLLQAYDFLELYRRYQCVVQIGGDDQWGNILAGADLVRRLHGVTVYGVTFPLLLTASDEKMGKTAAGAVWLNADRLSPYDYYQYWVNTQDADVARLLGFFTFLPMAEIKAIENLSGADLNAAKSILAYEATLIVHGQQEALAAHAAAQAAFGGRTIAPDLLPSSSIPRQAGADLSQLPTIELNAAEVNQGVNAVNLIVRAGLAPSNRQARNQLTQGQYRLDNEPIAVQYATEKLPADWFNEPRILQHGKKKVVVRLAANLSTVS